MIQIPSSPGYVKATPRFLDFSVPLTPPLGGVMQRLRRLGSRFALDVSMAPSREGAGLRASLAAVLLARMDGVAGYLWPQPGLDIGAPGAPVINGAGQSGTIVGFRGFTPGYSVRSMQAFSLNQGGRRYLYLFAAGATANGTGLLTAAILPALRKITVDGAGVNVAAPLIEGTLTGETFAWEHDLDAWVPLNFSIAEVA